MGTIRKRGPIVHLYQPLVTVKKTKGGTKKVPCSALDEVDYTSDLAQSGDYGLVVIDTFSKASDQILRAIVQQNLSETRKTPRLRVRAGKREINHPTQQDYGVAAGVLDEWYIELRQACALDTHVVLVGHEKMLGETDDEGDVYDAMGTISCIGRMFTRKLPGDLMVMLRLRLERRKKSKRSEGPMRVVRSVGDGTWVAKDRYGVFEEEGEDISIKRDDYEGPAEHKAAIVELAQDVWGPYAEIIASEGVPTPTGVYGPPGSGKTLFVAGLAGALYELTGKPTLWVDFDSEGGAQIPYHMVTEKTARRSAHKDKE